MRSLTPSGFGNDDGLADPAVRRALGAAVAEPSVPTYLAAVAELCSARVLVAVVARPAGGAVVGQGSEDAVDTGAAGDKESEMSVVLLRTADGRLGMLTFTGTDAMQAWDQQARPVPTTLDKAAAAARHDGADTLVVDLQGPHPLVIEGEVLDQLAAGHRLVALDDGQFGWAVPALRHDQDAARHDQDALRHDQDAPRHDQAVGEDGSDPAAQGDRSGPAV